MLTEEQVRELEREITARLQQPDLAALVAESKSDSANAPSTNDAHPNCHQSASATTQRRRRRIPRSGKSARVRIEAPDVVDFLKRAYSNPHVRKAMSELAEN
jgi:hypothetical protein